MILLTDEQAAKRRKPFNHIDAELMHKYFTYEPETGNLVRKVLASSNALSGEIAGTINRHRYVVVHLNGKLYGAHRIAWVMYYGEQPGQIDHINGIRSDNRIANLRIADDSQNQMNRSMQVNNTTGFKGVFCVKSTGRFHARITINKKKIFLGAFDNKEEAHKAYCDAAKSLHGEFFRSQQ